MSCEIYNFRVSIVWKKCTGNFILRHNCAKQFCEIENCKILMLLFIIDWGENKLIEPTC